MANIYNKETHQFENKDGIIWYNDVAKLAGQLVDQFERQERQIKHLQEENRKLKEGVWEKEEVARLKRDFEKMYVEHSLGFSITPEQNAKIKEWMKKYEGQHFGAIGGAFTYRFTPTGIGTFATVTGPDGDELKLQEAD